MDDPWASYEDCDRCESRSHRLVEHLLWDIQHLEAKVVCLRYSLSRYLEKHMGEMLRCDIFSDLAGYYRELPAYQQFVDAYCCGDDPMEQDDYIQLLKKLSKGTETVSW